MRWIIAHGPTDRKQDLKFHGKIGIGRQLMGLLQEGRWVVGTKPRILAGGSSAAQLSSGIGSLQTVHRDQMAKVALGLKLGGIIFMYRLLVRGRTAH